MSQTRHPVPDFYQMSREDIFQTVSKAFPHGMIWNPPIELRLERPDVQGLRNRNVRDFDPRDSITKTIDENYQNIMKIASLTPAEKTTPKKAASAAHPLFPAEQVFLWLPGQPGAELPFCSCNEAPDIPVSEGRPIIEWEERYDSDGNLSSPPFPVSHRTYVSWHTHVTPPVSFHPIPIKRFLSIAEMEDIARKVLEVTGTELPGGSHLLSILRNEYKCYILYFLARMGILMGVNPHRR